MNQINNPLHGVTLEQLLTELVAVHGWEALAQQITIQCFSTNPSIKSSLRFLRTTPWARAQVEALYVRLVSSRSGTSAGISASADPAPEA